MALVGAIIGDIIGSRFEFPSQRPDDLDWENIELFSPFCEYTDDTVMSIATKYALDHYDGNFARAYKEFGRRYPDVGYGDMFFKWINGDIEEYKSWGNGSAMRVSYIGDLVQDATSVLKLAKISAECTHGTYNGIRAAMVVANVIAMANLKYPKEDIATFISEHYPFNISTSLEELRKRYAWSDTAIGTVPAAIICFLESTDYESCIRNCLSLPCDMDTMCCIAGGMAEAFYGTTGLDNKKILEQYLDKFLYGCIKDIL